MGSSSQQPPLSTSMSTSTATVPPCSNSNPLASAATAASATNNNNNGPNYADLSTICSVVFGGGSSGVNGRRPAVPPIGPGQAQNWFQYPPWSCTMPGGPGPLHHPIRVRWPSFLTAGGGRSFWTKYCLLCTVCGSAATILAGIFLVVAALFRYYTTSIYYFETVPTYIPAILLSICGVSTIAFSCKRNRNIILLRITACWSLVSAALSSVITISTSLIHMNRLQTLKECVYSRNPPSCTCFGHSYGIEGLATGTEPVHFVFENTSDCDVIHGALYSCLRAVFAISVVAVLLSIFLCMLLYQLIGHERKKAYWSRIRRINSDWSSDFLACLSRPLPRDRSSMLPLMISNNPGTNALYNWGPPPPYTHTSEQLNVNMPDRDDNNETMMINNPPVRRTTILATATAPSPPRGNTPPGWMKYPKNLPSFAKYLSNPSSFSALLDNHHNHSSSTEEDNSNSDVTSTFSPTITTVLPGPSSVRPLTHPQPPKGIFPLRESKISIDTDSQDDESQSQSFSEKPQRISVPTPIVEDNNDICNNTQSHGHGQRELLLPDNQSPTTTKGKTSLPCSPLQLRNTMRYLFTPGRESLSCPNTPRRTRSLKGQGLASGLPILNLNSMSKNSYQDLC